MITARWFTEKGECLSLSNGQQKYSIYDNGDNFNLRRTSGSSYNYLVVPKEVAEEIASFMLEKKEIGREELVPVH